MIKLTKTKEIHHVQLYLKIKKRCQFQLRFSNFLLIVFFVLQYSVPIFLVVLGSVATSREQLVSFLKVSPSPSTHVDQEQSSQDQAKEDADILVSKIIFLLGIITILLGVINNTIRPAESYDTSSNFNNKFNKFIIDLDLEILQIGGIQPTLSANTPEAKLIFNLLIKKNHELFNLIDDYNKARSLSPRQANIKALNQNDEKEESENDSISSVEVYENKNISLIDDIKDSSNRINTNPLSQDPSDI